MYVHNIDPVLFAIGPLEVRYYGLLYSISFLLILMLAPLAFRRRRVLMNDDQISVFAVGMFMAGIVGARIAFVLANDFGYYLGNPLKILAVWEGGVGSVGAFAGCIVFGLIYLKVKGIEVSHVADIAMTYAGILAGSIRLGNFLNAEVVGTPTSLPWAVAFPPDYAVPRHPVALYQAAFHYALLGVMLFFFFRRATRPGFLFWLYMLIYPAQRLAFDFLREGPRFFFGLTMVQLICIPWIVVAAVFLVRTLVGAVAEEA